VNLANEKPRRGEVVSRPEAEVGVNLANEKPRRGEVVSRLEAEVGIEPAYADLQSAA
jgi:hypothetical protein